MKSVRKSGIAILAVMGMVLFPARGFCAVETHQAPAPQPGGIGDEPGHVSQQMNDLRETRGQIDQVDLRNGRLILREPPGAGTDAQRVEYAINPRDTSVSDPLDKKFLKLEDLAAGQWVTVEFVQVNDRRMARAITVDLPPPVLPVSAFIAGEVVRVDLQMQELTVREVRGSGTVPPEVTYRIYHPENAAIFDARTGQPVRFEGLRVGQWVQIGVEQRADGLFYARSIAVGPTYEPAYGLTVMSGELESVDLAGLTLAMRETRPGWKATEATRFILSSDTPVTDFQGVRILPLSQLRAGDRVQIQFVRDSDGRTIARHIAVYGSTQAQ